MGASSRFGFRQVPLGGGLPTTQIGQTVADPYSGETPNQNDYYLVIDGDGNGTASNGVRSTDVIGIIAYDRVNSRWAFILTKETHLTNAVTPWSNDFGQINDFMAALAVPLLTQNPAISGTSSLPIPIGQGIDYTAGHITQMCDPIQ